mgnify:CR=1 FL=1
MDFTPLLKATERRALVQQSRLNGAHERQPGCGLGTEPKPQRACTPQVMDLNAPATQALDDLRMRHSIRVSVARGDHGMCRLCGVEEETATAGSATMMRRLDHVNRLFQSSGNLCLNPRIDIPREKHTTAGGVHEQYAGGRVAAVHPGLFRPEVLETDAIHAPLHPGPAGSGIRERFQRFPDIDAGDIHGVGQCGNAAAMIPTVSQSCPSWLAGTQASGTSQSVKPRSCRKMASIARPRRSGGSKSRIRAATLPKNPRPKNWAFGNPYSENSRFIGFSVFSRISSKGSSSSDG